ncbi:unnamed protein product [Ectocarpus fasciculatus]
MHGEDARPLSQWVVTANNGYMSAPGSMPAFPSPPNRVDESPEAYGLDRHTVGELVRRQYSCFVPSWEEFVAWNVMDYGGQQFEWIWNALFMEVMESAHTPYFVRPRTWTEWISCYKRALGVEARGIVIDVESGVGHIPISIQRGFIDRRPVSGDILVAWTREAACAVMNELRLPDFPVPAVTAIDDEACDARSH